MSNYTNQHENHAGHGDYERRDISVSAVVYFLLAIVVACILSYFVVDVLYKALDKRSESLQPPLSPMITNAPKDTRMIPRDYPQTVFPSPKLEENERDQLDGVRLQEEDTLATYGWVDQQAGTVRIPINRAMDLLVQRGLPVRQGAAEQDSRQTGTQQPAQEQKGSNKKK